MRIQDCLSLEPVIFVVIGPGGFVEGSRLFEFGAGYVWCNRSEGGWWRVKGCLRLELFVFGVIGPRGFVEGLRLFEFGAGLFWGSRSKELS